MILTLTDIHKLTNFVKVSNFLYENHLHLFQNSGHIGLKCDLKMKIENMICKN